MSLPPCHGFCGLPFPCPQQGLGPSPQPHTQAKLSYSSISRAGAGLLSGRDLVLQIRRWFKFESCV